MASIPEGAFSATNFAAPTFEQILIDLIKMSYNYIYLQREEGEHLECLKRKCIPSTVNMGVTNVSKNKTYENYNYPFVL